MNLSKERIRTLARNLVQGLTGRQFIEASMAENELIDRVHQVIAKEQLLEDRLDEEVRGMIKAHQKDIQSGAADPRKLFLMIKKKLAKDRGIVL